MKLIALALLTSTAAFAGPLRTFVNDGSGGIDACRYDDAAVHSIRANDTVTLEEQDELMPCEIDQQRAEQEAAAQEAASDPMGQQRERHCVPQSPRLR